MGAKIMRKLRKLLRQSKGFTLAELMISTFILTFVIAGVIVSFFHCMYINELAHNSAKALTAEKGRISEIENTPFNQIAAAYNNTTFTAPDINGIGITKIDSSNPDVLVITLSFSWRQGNGRIIGEDLNLNGQINSGEDTNNNGILDSPAKISTSIYNM